MASRKRRIPLMENLDSNINEEPTTVEPTLTEETLVETPEIVNDFAVSIPEEVPQELDQPETPVEVTPCVIKPRKVIFPKKDNSSYKNRNVPRFS